ncbi:hypothetical protein ACJX0J_025820 [Zea mays]
MDVLSNNTPREVMTLPLGLTGVELEDDISSVPLGGLLEESGLCHYFIEYPELFIYQSSEILMKIQCGPHYDAFFSFVQMVLISTLLSNENCTNIEPDNAVYYITSMILHYLYFHHLLP